MGRRFDPDRAHRDEPLTLEQVRVIGVAHTFTKPQKSFFFIFNHLPTVQFCGTSSRELPHMPNPAKRRLGRDSGQIECASSLIKKIEKCVLDGES